VVIIRTIINNYTFDGSLTDPMQMAIRDALLGFMAAIGEAQAEATKDAQRAGIAHVKASGKGKGGTPPIGDASRHSPGISSSRSSRWRTRATP
jgi:putative DNA-invertase from lambdoid prophage Rac